MPVNSPTPRPANRVMTQPAVEDDDKARGIVTAPPSVAKVVTKVEAIPVPPIPSIPEALEEGEEEVLPEPALTAADHIPPSQDDLAVLTIAQQTIAQRRTMTPNDPSYKFTDEDRKAAIEARKEKKFDWEEANLNDALSYLASIRAEVERGGLVLQRRVSELKVERVKCFGCDNEINISEGRWATMRTRNNFETGLSESAYACSAACGLKLNRGFSHPLRVPVSTER